MKLVRVISTEGQDTANFSNLFTDQIKIDPYSQVALINASLSLTTITLNVNSSNNTFTFKNSDRGAQYTATMRNGDYSKTTFLNEINRAMNSRIPYDGTQNNNYQWTASTAGNNVLSLTWANSSRLALSSSEFSGGFSLNTSFQTPSPNNVRINGNEGLGQQGKSYWYASSNQAFTFGSGQMQCSLNCVGGFGLLNASNAPTDVLTDADIVYGIFCNADQKYDVVINGVRQTTTETCTSSLVPSIELSNGKVNFIANTATGFNLVTSVDFPYDGSTLLPFAQVLGKYDTSGLAINNLKWNRDPAVSNDNIGNKQSIPSIQFTAGSRTLLGFDSDSLTGTSGTTFAFTAFYSLIDTTPPVSLAVVLPQLGSMDSYDGKIQRRSQLVSVIPSLIKTNQDMSYNAPYPLFIDINNAFPIILSEFEVRLLDSATGEPVSLEAPGCSLTFAIKSRKE